MTKDFDFQMLVIYVISVQVASTIERVILHKLHSYEVGLTQLFIKSENLSIQQTVS